MDVDFDYEAIMREAHAAQGARADRSALPGRPRIAPAPGGFADLRDQEAERGRQARAQAERERDVTPPLSLVERAQEARIARLARMHVATSPEVSAHLFAADAAWSALSRGTR